MTARQRPPKWLGLPFVVAGRIAFGIAAVMADVMAALAWRGLLRKL